MALIKFEFQDLHTGWHCHPFELGGFNLLVGLSGVGKTRILTALQQVAYLARGEVRDIRFIRAARWALVVGTGGRVFTWEGEMRLGAAMPKRRSEEALLWMRRSIAPEFVQEKISEDGIVLAERGEGGARLGSQELPRLKTTESLLSLLRDEPGLAPLFEQLRGVRGSVALQYNAEFRWLGDDWKRLETEMGERVPTLDELRADATFPLEVRAWLLQKYYPDRFKRVQERVVDIFPTVEEIQVGRTEEFESDPVVLQHAFWAEAMVLAIRERGIARWTYGREISSGMLRTMLHLMELELTAAGAVTLVDEFENSMGVNCLDSVTELLRDRTDIQFIVTSHHPWVINAIPREQWKVVSRQGSEITVLDAASVPRLDTASRQDPFVQLVNSLEYLEGVG